LQAAHSTGQTLQEIRFMLRARLPRLPIRRPLRRFASLCAVAALLLPVGCDCTLPMNRLLLNGPPTPGPSSSALTPPLRLTIPQGEEDDAAGVMRTSYKARAAAPATQNLPAPEPLPDSVGTAAQGVAVNLDIVMRQTFERNGDILVARERVNESAIALDAALRSCMPEALRKDTFKRAVAEATVWKRRAELRKVEKDNLQEAANAYFDWLTALRGEAVTSDLMRYDEKLLQHARRLAKTDTPAQVIVEASQSALETHRQSLLGTRRQAQGATVNLAHLMGTNDGGLTTNETLEPIDRVDTTVSVEVLVRQAQDNGPGVRELQGLAAAIQQGIDSARGAQCICKRTGAPMVCGRLQMAHSELQQAQLSLASLRAKLRAGVEEAFSAILSGREQIVHASEAIQHAAESYRLTDLRLQEQGPEANRRNNTYAAVLNSIQQLSQAHASYLRAVAAYNKAQIRLLLLLGTYNECATNAH
jgi:outer membrane protein TolC